MSRKKIQNDVARRVFVPDMKILEVCRNKQTGTAEYTPVKNSGRGIFPDYPVLVQKNGIPWTLGNIYLLKRMEESRNYEPKTWENISNDLLHYLRWLEATTTNPLFFPEKQKFNRPTYLYRDHLIAQVSDGKMALSTASQRMNSIVRFYRGLVGYRVIKNDILGLAWEEKQVLIKVLGQDLNSRLHSITTTDLSIRKPPTTDNHEHIRDGGRLRPLSEEEQSIIFQHLKYSSINYRLIFSFSTLTGARFQTVCTLRGETLQSAVRDKSNKRYFIHIGGPGHRVDTKGGKQLTIVIPEKLYDLLLIHWKSRESIERRVKSFYGNTNTNYIFLTKEGQPYITSKDEKFDRRDPNINRRVGINGATSTEVKTRKGQSIWSFINNILLPRIRKHHPEFKSFSFHDLRATFGMNTLETLLRAVDKQNEKLKSQGKEATYGIEWVLEQIQGRMGHSDLQTTMRYLDFKRNNQFRAMLQSSVEDQLMKYIPETVLEYDYD